MQSRTTAVALLVVLVATSGCASIMGGSGDATTNATNATNANEMGSATQTTAAGTGPTAEITGGIDDENVSYSGAQPVLEPGASTDLELTVSNQLGEQTEFEAVVVLQRYETTNTSADQQYRVVSNQTLATETVTVADGERKTVTPSITAEEEGTNALLVFMVFEGEAPENPTADAATNAFTTPIDVGSSDDDEQVNTDPTQTSSNSSALGVPV